jgi:hypothetical protein
MTESMRMSRSASGGRVIGRLGSTWAGIATVLAAAALLVGASDQAIADATQNHLWTGCVLGSNSDETDTTAALLGDLEANSSGIGTNDLGTDGVCTNESPCEPQVAFALVYSVKHENDGQPLEDSSDDEFTGPVLCLNGDDFDLSTTTQTTKIPPSGDANFLDVEHVFIVRYQVISTGKIEKVLCHTVKDNTDCVLISPK